MEIKHKNNQFNFVCYNNGSYEAFWRQSEQEAPLCYNTMRPLVWVE